MDNLGIEVISVFGMPPVAYIELAAELRCKHVSLSLSQMDYNPHNYPRYALRDDPALRREVKAALRANGVALSLGDNFPVLPGADSTEQWKADLDIMSELGAVRINSVSFEKELQRNVDQYGALAEMAGALGIETLIEFVPIFAIADMPMAVEVVRQVGRPDLGFIFDTMHAARTGVTVADVRAVPPNYIGYVQLCDAPLTSAMDYMDEAMHERMAPGDGELPLAAYLSALPRDRVISLEIPLRTEAEAGKGPRERLERCVKATHALLASI